MLSLSFYCCVVGEGER